MTTGEGVALDQYTRLYKDHHAGLLAYARTLSAGPAQAGDLVAEARFRVWRRYCAGQRIDDVPGQLRETARALAADPARTEAVRTEALRADVGPADGQEAGQVGRVASVLSQLPQRWLRVLWLTEVEGRPLDAVAQDLGTGRSAAAVLLHQAHEGLRQGVRRTAQPHADTLELARIGQRDLVSRRNEERLAALTGPALLVLADTAVGSGLLSLAATATPAARPTGATRAAHRPVVSHRGPRRRRPVRMAAAGGLVAVAAGLVTAVALTGAAPAAHTTAAAAPTVGPTGTSAFGPGPLTGATTPLRASHAAPASTSATRSAATVFTAAPASASGRPATTAGLAPAGPSLTHGTTAVPGTPSTATARRPTSVTSPSRAGTPTATPTTAASAAPTATRSTTPTSSPSVPTSTSPSGTASVPTSSPSVPTSTSPSGAASVPPSKTPTATATTTVSPTGTSSPTTNATFSSSSATATGSASPTGTTTP